MVLRWCAVIASGILLGLSQPLVVEYFGPTPVDATGLSGLFCLIGYVPLFLALKGQAPGRTFLLVFATSLLQFSIIFYWIFFPLHVFGRVGVLPSVALCLLLAAESACFIAAGATISQLIISRLKWPAWLCYALCLCSAEYLRNYLPFGGFPWGSVGSALATVPLLRQSAAVVGVYGLAFLVLLINGAIASLWLERNGKAKMIPVACGALVLLSMTVFGAIRIARWDAEKKIDSITISLLQGNVEQGIKNHQALYAEEILDRYAALQERAVAAGAQLVVWPESAFPLRIQQSARGVSSLKTGGAATIIGAISYERGISSNSAFGLNPQGEVVGRYDKRHRVPFGEYVPWPFKGIVDKVVPGVGAWNPGEGYAPITISLADGQQVVVGITVCYEGVFPEISRALVNNGAQILVNMTNDAWYGVSSASYQHLMMYVLRSVETGRYNARATNTGVSAFVDPTGRVFDATPLYQQAIVNRQIALVNDKTPYLAIGDLVPKLCMLLSFLGLTRALLGQKFLGRRRKVGNWVLGLGGSLLASCSMIILIISDNLEENQATQAVVTLFFGMSLFFGAFSGKKWGSLLLRWVGGTVAVLSLALAWLEGPVFLIYFFVGVTVFLFGFKQH